MPIRIQRKRTKGWRAPDGTVMCTRGTRWGNPFRIGDPMPAAASACVCHDCTPGYWAPGFVWWGFDWPTRRASMTRHDVVGAYAWQLRLRPEGWLEPLRRAPYPACWCAIDEACHVDAIIAELARTRPVAAPGEPIEMGVHAMPGTEAEGAPAWPSLGSVQSRRQSAYRAFVRGAR